MSIRRVTMTVFDWQVVNAHTHVCVRDYLLVLQLPLLLLSLSILFLFLYCVVNSSFQRAIPNTMLLIFFVFMQIFE